MGCLGRWFFLAIWILNSYEMIRIDNISKSYGKRLALDSVSIKVSKNEIFGLIGPDGAGKTSLFRILSSLIIPDSGNARIGNLDVVKDYREIRKIIGYMPGRFSLYQDLTVEENLEFFATVFSTSIKENYDLIKDIYIHIEPFKDRKAGKLSGGMKQKLALSCALIHRPEVLILDEPTTGVDAVSRREFWEMLSRIREEGITIIVSTPYMDEAQLCDRVGLLQNGKLLTINSPEGIIQAYPKDILSIQSDNLYSMLMDLRNYPLVHSSLLFGHKVHYTEKGKNIDQNQLKEYLKRKGHANVEMNLMKPGIEDSFLELMKE